jgi:cytochrome c biogenesis protein CcdA
MDAAYAAILIFVIPILGDWKLDAALGSCLLLGLRHGFDYDHLAAISDITAVQRNWRSGLRLGMTYALGHAFTVAALGIAVLELHMGLPEGLDHWTERLIGLTLIVLGIGVVAGILRKDAHGHSHSRIESRLAIAINGDPLAGLAGAPLLEPSGPNPSAFSGCTTESRSSSSASCTAWALKPPASWRSFFLTANLGGTSRGMMGLAAFALGLVAMNALMTASMGGAFRASGHHHPRFYHAIAWTGAAYSFIIGIIFLFGISDRLPSLG